jgi:hypothetical protein
MRLDDGHESEVRLKVTPVVGCGNAKAARVRYRGKKGFRAVLGYPVADTQQKLEYVISG